MKAVLRNYFMKFPRHLLKREIILFGSALLCMFIAVIITISHVSDINKSFSPHDSFIGSNAHAHPPGRILVILIDSVRTDFMFSTNMPFISELRRQSAWGISEVTSFPLSVAGDIAIFSGKIPNPFFSLFNDFESSAATDDNIFKRLAEQRRHIAILSSATVRGLYGQYADLSVFKPCRFLFSQYREEARCLFNQSLHFLKKGKWDFAVVQFITLDYAGHLETPLSPGYKTACRLIDDYVRQLVALTGDDDTILITSEHGIDNYGFHMDRKSMVVETPFILKGPWIKTGGPAMIKQMDLAPTLSILAGVSPFYESLALPAFDLLDIPGDYATSLLSRFRQIMGDRTNSPLISELRVKRDILMKIRVSPSTLVISAVAISLSLLLFLYLILTDIHQWRSWKGIIGHIFAFFSVLLISIYGTVFAGFFSILEGYMTFSAHFIRSHLAFDSMAMAMVALLSFIFAAIKKKLNIKDNPRLLLMVFIFLLASALMNRNPYNFFNWLILFIPLVGWGISRKISWLVIFSSLLVALFIRRLSFYNAFNPFGLPERWQLLAFVIICGILFQWWQLRKGKDIYRHMAMGFISLMPAFISLLSNNIEIRVICILISLLLLIRFTKNNEAVMDIWWAIWIVFLLLGTSSRIELTTHIIALPLFMAILSASRNTSVVTRGILVSIFFWSLYMIPGNAFDLKLLELRDSFTMSAASTGSIETTVFIILIRYLLPIVIVIWFVFRLLPRVSLWSLASITIIPIVFAAGLRMMLLLGGVYEYYPWEEYTRLIVLLVSIMLIVSSLFIVAITTQIADILSVKNKEQSHE